MSATRQGELFRSALPFLKSASHPLAARSHPLWSHHRDPRSDRERALPWFRPMSPIDGKPPSAPLLSMPPVVRTSRQDVGISSKDHTLFEFSAGNDEGGKTTGACDVRAAHADADLADSGKTSATDMSMFLHQAIEILGVQANTHRPAAASAYCANTGTCQDGMNQMLPSIADLVSQIKIGKSDQKQQAAKMLGVIAVNHPENKAAIASAGGIEPLVILSQCGTDGEKEQAAGALCSLARDRDNKMSIAQAGGITALVALVRSGTDGQKEEAAAALCNLARNRENKEAIAAADGISPLIALIHGGTEAQKVKAAGALAMIASGNADNGAAIAQAGGVEPLRALVRSGTVDQKKMAAMVLSRVRGGRSRVDRSADSTPRE